MIFLKFHNITLKTIQIATNSRKQNEKIPYIKENIEKRKFSRRHFQGWRLPIYRRVGGPSL